MKYYIGRNGQQLGPYERAELQRMVGEGGVLAGDLVWTEGMPAWAPVFDVIPRAPSPAAPPAPAPAAPVPPPAAAAPLVHPGFSPDLAATQISKSPFNFDAAPVAASPAASAPAPASPLSSPLPHASAPPAPAAQKPFSPMAAPPPAAPIPSAQPFSPGFPAPAAPAAAAWTPPAPSPAGFAGPIPPDMHWPLVYVLSAVTFNIFMIVWIFKQLNFVKTIDPGNKSRTMILAGVGLIVAYVVMAIAGTVSNEPTLLAVGGLLALAGAVCMILAVFQMRTSLVNYYNSVEPIQLRLSGIMTFFFNFLYFQYHFRRIADWKLGREISQITGRLRP